MIEGNLNPEQRKVYDMIKDIISEYVLVEPISNSSTAIMLSGQLIFSRDIRSMIIRGLCVYYLTIGKLAVSMQ